ncbi:hypothetical protein MKI84_08345 [Ancylobacter sp. A5.8]|uniref:hypothetical protein n=1 Tax=Ancylobacter gelatini TaxID=2919920 RepID=UPI001F4DA562|nr:hypothetical protein [Ancylobacter gelatini]MCJ8142924.1 hypothetical protein [Ancylobacter gelatini]
MKLLIVISAILATTALPVAAQDYQPQPWQGKAAQQLPTTFGKIKKAHWSQSISLWLAVDRDKTDWTAATPMICNALAAAGKPHDAFVAISYLDWRTFPAMDVIAKAYCEPKPPAPPESTAPAESLGVMGADGIIRPE